MVYGHCVDRYDEFFIIPFHKASAIPTTGWCRLFTIDHSKIPNHLPLSTIESILFVGKAIATINEIERLSSSTTLNSQDEGILAKSNSLRDVSQTKRIVVPEEMRQRHLELLHALHSSKLQRASSLWAQYPQMLQNTVTQVRRSTSDWLFSQVLIGDHGLHCYLSSFRRVFLLSFGDWASNFSKECLCWRKRSSNQNRSKEIMHRNVNSPALVFQRQELNTLLIKSSLNTDIENQLSGYRLLVESEQTENFVFSDMLLGNLGVVLTFDLEWPIDLFLNETHLKAYSNMWSFLISLKYTQVSLNGLWKMLRENSHSNQDKKTLAYTTGGSLYYNSQSQEIAVWRLRSLMLFWVDTLWSHLQAHVIDVHYENLIDVTTLSGTANANKRQSKPSLKKLDFEEIQEAHEKFLLNVQHGCLLTSKDCVKTMCNILRTCSDFCTLMEKLAEEGEWRTSKRRRTTKTASEIVNNWMADEEAPLWMSDIENIEEEFRSSTEVFFSLASSQPPEIKSNGKLDILLTQLDYNKWFSKSHF
ncbi:Spc98 family-domain-containing protein [Sporodiniella umbellata]|nr:Spc98 family-domain-containing protein [Sporodiniella umbellata]